jgi:hypothetical protein
VTETDQFDPFAGIDDQAEATAADARSGLLRAAKRGYVPLRKEFVQRRAGSALVGGRPSARASVLYDIVNSRNQRAFDLFLLLHAYQPILGGSPLRLATWANILSVKSSVDTTSVSRAIDTLAGLGLVVREDSSRTPVLRLLREDGSKEPWEKPGAVADEGPGYFVIPHAYWDLGLSEVLTMPGKAMFLIMLAETQNPKTPAFAMAVERAREWYGISERTAERGYRELNAANALKVKVQKVTDPRHPAGRREIYWRALHPPFDTPSRVRMQRAATKATRAVGKGSTGDSSKGSAKKTMTRKAAAKKAVSKRKQSPSAKKAVS